MISFRRFSVVTLCGFIALLLPFSAGALTISSDELTDAERGILDRLNSAFSEVSQETIERILPNEQSHHFKMLILDSEEFASRKDLPEELLRTSAEILAQIQTQFFNKSMSSYLADDDAGEWKNYRIERTIEETGDNQYVYLKFFYQAERGENQAYLRLDFYLQEGQLVYADVVDLVRNLSSMASGIEVLSLYAKHPEDKKLHKKLTALAQGAVESDFKSVSRIFRSLPKEFREVKAIRAFYLTALLAQPKWETNKKAMSYFTNNYSEGFESALINYYLHEKKYDAALDAYEQLHQRVGGGSWILANKARVQHYAGLEQQSFENFAALVEEFPEVKNQYFQILDIFVEQKQYDDAMLVVKVLYSSFDLYLDPKELAKLEGNYPDFGKFPALAEWNRQLGE